MRISLALAAAALCFSTVGCACPRCPYLGYPIPPRVSMVDAEGNDFPDAPPAKPVKPVKAEKQKGQKAASESEPRVTLRKGAGKSSQLATRAGVKAAKPAPAKTQVAAKQPTAGQSAKPTAPKMEAADQGASQLLAAGSKPTVRAASTSKPVSATPAAQSRPAKPAAAAGSSLAGVIEVAPPAAKGAQAVMPATPAAPAAPPRLKQPGIVAGRGARPGRAEQPKQEEPKKPQLQAGEARTTEATQVVHLEAGK